MKTGPGLIKTDEPVNDLAGIRFHNYGGAPAAIHNMPCPQCVKEPAVIQLDDRQHRPTFQPCWSCQKEGWVTVKATGWRRHLLTWMGLIDG